MAKITYKKGVSYENKLVTESDDLATRLEEILIELGWLGRRPVFVNMFCDAKQYRAVKEGNFELLSKEALEELLGYAQATLAAAARDHGAVLMDCGTRLSIFVASPRRFDIHRENPNPRGAGRKAYLKEGAKVSANERRTGELNRVRQNRKFLDSLE
jgi:hypothetical protein